MCKSGRRKGGSIRKGKEEKKSNYKFFFSESGCTRMWITGCDGMVQRCATHEFPYSPPFPFFRVILSSLFIPQLDDGIYSLKKKCAKLDSNSVVLGTSPVE